MEVEIDTFVVKGSAQLTVTLDRQEYIQVGSRGVALRRVFDLKLSVIHLAQIILKIWVIDGQYVIDVSVCEVESSPIQLQSSLSQLQSSPIQLKRFFIE